MACQLTRDLALLCTSGSAAAAAAAAAEFPEDFGRSCEEQLAPQLARPNATARAPLVCLVHARFYSGLWDEI